MTAIFDTDCFTKEEPTELCNFLADDPVVSIFKFTKPDMINDQFVTGHPRYSELTENQDFSSSSWSAPIKNETGISKEVQQYIPHELKDKKIIEYTNKVREYYNTEFAVKKLRGINLTPWEHSYSVAMQAAKENRLSAEQVYLIAKTQHLYEYQIQFNWLSRNYTSVDAEVFDNWEPDSPRTVVEQTITFLKYRESPIKNRNISYLFVNDKNELVEIEILVKGRHYFDTVIALSPTITIHGVDYLRQVHTEDFIYHRFTHPKVIV